MATELRLRGGTTVQHASFTGATKEITVDTTKNTVVVHDGSTAGGVPLATESNLTSEVNSSVHAPGTGLPNEIQTYFNNTLTSTSTAQALTAAQGKVLKDEIDDIVAQNTGAVQFFARNTAPNGWLKANGAAVSRTTYAALFAAIGTTFGAGNGSTTFNLPDMRGEFPRGWDDGRGVDAGRAFGTAQLDQMQRITGGFNIFARFTASSGVFTHSGPGTRTTGGTTSADGTMDFNSANSPDARTSSTTDGETRSRNIALLACIKF